MRCAICGKEITSTPTIDHVYPKALYKWSECYVSKERYRLIKRIVENSGNKLLVHKHCNVKKEEALPEIDALYVDGTTKTSLKNRAIRLEAVIETYANNKLQKIIEQKYKCFCCNKPINVNTGVLRRIQPQKKRVWENACIVCHKCNINNPSFRPRNKQWKKQLKAIAV